MTVSGKLTKERFPHLRADAERVQLEQSFEIKDLAWIAPCLSTAVRVSIADGTGCELRKHGFEVERDAIYGEGAVSTHMLFSWVGPASGSSGDTHRVGHFDLLTPCSYCALPHFLPPDAAWCGALYNRPNYRS